MLGLAVPVMKNFKGFTELMQSVDEPVLPIVIDNWTKNQGVSYAWNTAIDKAREQSMEALIIVNDDIKFRPGCISALKGALNYYTFVSACDSKTMDSAGNFACFAIRPETFVQKYGYFDMNFWPAYFEDNDMTYRIKLTGDPCHSILEAVVDHAGSVTQNMDGPVCDSIQFEKNRKYYVMKWGGWPGDERYQTPYGREDFTLKDWIGR